jgi:N-acetylmuramoyl-L-alanine amidase
MFFSKKIQAAFFMVFLFSLSASALHILIDPGHGGRDKGALQAGYSEAEIVWAWSLELKKMLSLKNFEVELSRNETSGMALQKRVSKLNQKKYDLILSLHANYLMNSRIKGAEYFISAPLNLEEQKLAQAHEEVLLKNGERKIKTALASLNEEQKSQVTSIINDLEKQARLQKSLNIAEKLNQFWPGKIKQGPYDLLGKAESPAVLVELGYLSNPSDLKNLLDPRFRLEKSIRLAEAISGYFNNSKSNSVR